MKLSKKEKQNKEQKKVGINLIYSNCKIKHKITDLYGSNFISNEIIIEKKGKFLNNNQ